MRKHYREQPFIIASIIVTTLAVVTTICRPMIARAEGSLIDAVVLLNKSTRGKVEAGTVFGPPGYGPSAHERVMGSLSTLGPVAP